MHSVFNANLFSNVAVQSRGFNNLCTLIHPLQKEGEYSGEIYSAGFLLGRFRVTCDKQLDTTQVDIDAASFDGIKKKNSDPKETGEKKYQTGAEGFILFYTSGAHKDLHIVLSAIEHKENVSNPVIFDSRKLGPGDIIVLRPFHPGTYNLVNIDGQQRATFKIAENKERYPHPSKLPPLTIPLQEDGFKLPKTDIYPFQALIVQAEINCSLELKMEGKRPARSSRIKTSI